MTVTVVRGDARSLPLADDSVDLVVTSPPYFGLRSMGEFGSLTCVPCMERDAERRALIWGTTREATT